MARRHLLHLAQGPLAGRQVVVVGRGRGRRRIVAVAHHRGVEFRGPGQGQGVGRLVDGDLMLGPGAVADDDLRIGLGALLPGEEILHQGRALDEPARRVRHEVRPVRLTGRVGRRLDDLEVDGLVGVGADHPPVAPVVRVIAAGGHPRVQHPRRPGHVVGRQVADLGGLLVLDRDQHEPVVGAAPDADEHAVVVFLIDQGGLAAAGRATEDLVRAAVVVPVGPEDPPAVRREGEIAGRRLDRVGQHLAGGQVLHIDLVHLGPLRVLGVGEQGVVGAVVGGADLGIGLAGREGVGVEQHLRIARAGAGLAHESGVLIPGLVLGEILPRPVGRRHRTVVFLDAPLHLLEHLGLQRQGRGHHRLAIGVLGGQMFLDVRLDQGRIAQHRLPVVVLHPLVVVDPDAAQLFDPHRDLLRDGRDGGGLGHRNSGSAGGGGQGGRRDGGRGGDEQVAAVHRVGPPWRMWRGPCASDPAAVK